MIVSITSMVTAKTATDCNIDSVIQPQSNTQCGKTRFQHVSLTFYPAINCVSSASNHMIWCPSNLYTIKYSTRHSKVQIADGDSVLIYGIRTLSHLLPSLPLNNAFLLSKLSTKFLFVG